MRIKHCDIICGPHNWQLAADFLDVIVFSFITQESIFTAKSLTAKNEDYILFDDELNSNGSQHCNERSWQCCGSAGVGECMIIYYDHISVQL